MWCLVLLYCSRRFLTFGPSLLSSVLSNISELNNPSSFSAFTTALIVFDICFTACTSEHQRMKGQMNVNPSPGAIHGFAHNRHLHLPTCALRQRPTVSHWADTRLLRAQLVVIVENLRMRVAFYFEGQLWEIENVCGFSSDNQEGQLWLDWKCTTSTLSKVQAICNRQFLRAGF